MPSNLANGNLMWPLRVVRLAYLPACGGCGGSSFSGEKRDLLLVRTQHEVLVYNPFTNTVRTVSSMLPYHEGASDSLPERADSLTLVLYQESFVHFDGMTRVSESHARKKRTETVTLQDELITEVLLRLPARSLARFRCVSRSWNGEITSPGFVDRHHALAATSGPSKIAFVPLGQMHRCLASMGIFKDWAEEKSMMGCGGCPRLVGLKACRGLVLIQQCPGGGGATFTVCNPSTGGTVELPPIQSDMIMHLVNLAGIGVDASTGEINLARTVRKRLLPVPAFIKAAGDKPAGAVNAVLQVELGGSLCLTRLVVGDGAPAHVQIWKLEDYDAGLWSLDYRVDLPTIPNTPMDQKITTDFLDYLTGTSCGGGGLPSSSSEKRELLLATSHQELAVYNPCTKTFRKLATPPAGDNKEGGRGSVPDRKDSASLVLYHESLVRFEGMRYDNGGVEFVPLNVAYY
ncbi:hypothetical protein QOZ80_4BG0352180 [Eleusine coracana subsp. coracana]|nr:hypothetical protein QOZ80_4BG0352180 [Eleusine coracana subsp. coracana]